MDLDAFVFTSHLWSGRSKATPSIHNSKGGLRLFLQLGGPATPLLVFALLSPPFKNVFFFLHFSVWDYILSRLRPQTCIFFPARLLSILPTCANLSHSLIFPLTVSSFTASLVLALCYLLSQLADAQFTPPTSKIIPQLKTSKPQPLLRLVLSSFSNKRQ